MTEKTITGEKSQDTIIKNDPKWILVVDDDPDIRIMIKIMLEFKGYAVDTLERGEASQEMLMTGKFGLVIMDMLLSGMNGVDICASIKQNTSISHIPIIMISAHPNARATCIEAGANDFVAKPFDMQEILSTIEKYIPAPGK